MKIQIGTRVKFLNEVGGGIVTGFSDDRYALVETEDGFEMPVLLNELLIESADAYDEEGNKAIPQKETSQVAPQASFEDRKFQEFKGDVCLAIVPQNDQLMHVTNFDLFLINDSNYSFSYCLAYNEGGIYTLIENGEVEADTKIELGEYSQSALSKLEELRLQGFFYKTGLFGMQDPVDRVFRLGGVSFYKGAAFGENAFFHQKALILKDPKKDKLSKSEKKEEIKAILKEKEEQPAKPAYKSPKQSESLEEVDLHIEQILDNHAGMSNAEIVRTQMARFETALETARQAKTSKIVFIHGVGNGRLKHELRKTLDRKYSDLRYQDASFKEYGFGATLVYL